VRQIKKGSTDQSVIIRIVDSGDGTPETGVEHNTSGIDLFYRREGAAVVSITEAALSALTDAHSDGGIEHIGGGYYRLDLPDAAVASGANGVFVGGTITNMVVIGCYIHLVDFDPQDTVRLGLTALPNAAAEASGGLYTRGTGAGQINQPANGVVDANVVSGAGTAWNSGAIGPNTLASDTIAAAKIATGAITAGKFAADAITSTVVADNAITANKIANDAIAAAKIATGAITNAKFAAGAIDAAAIASDAIALAKLASDVKARLLASASVTKLDASALTIILGTVDDTVSPTTTQFESDDITEATADHYNGRLVIFTSGALLGQGTTIEDYALVSGRGRFTCTALTEAPANDVTFIII